MMSGIEENADPSLPGYARSNSSLNSSGIPQLPPDSPGSSVSSRLQNEYDQLLKLATILPEEKELAIEEDLRSLSTIEPAMYDPEEERNNTLTPRSDRQEQGINVQVIKENGNHSLDVQVVREFNDVEKADSIANSLGSDPLLTRKFSLPAVGDSKSESDTSSIRSALAAASYKPSIDADMSRIETLLDSWLYDVKKNVLDECSQLKLRMLERERDEILKEKKKTTEELLEYQKQIDSLKEVLNSYEQTCHKKDTIINNLSKSLQKSKDKMETLKTFCEWRLNHADSAREKFCTKMAAKQHDISVKKTVFFAWKSIVQTSWKVRAEKACQAKAEEICRKLSDDYETKISKLNGELEDARTVIAKLHGERERYEDSMKKAFMRGVSALNTEAMAIFNGDEEEKPQRSLDVAETDEPERINVPIPTHSQTDPLKARAALVAKKSTKPRSFGPKSELKNACAQGAVHTLRPPVSSIVVERHQPVVKETVGQATAMCYPAKKTNNMKTNQKKGQSTIVRHVLHQAH
ncbi:DgyrCDS5548 [Dimorphilus gyrociliatus]|uniref:Centrosomal protein POC5 n=1 Tax=Dimorphilus gyrociliatus TaxID=2664684 RepID=A0A7I8VMI8_9ANNE|nr:DgyrCDS5548 [Dimorphilus gyrociliatus]